MNLAKPSMGRPKDLEKRAALIEAAARLFCEQGYEATSVEQIAQAAGVSKLTVYSHFGDKEGLFHAAVSARCEGSLPHRLFEPKADLPFEQALRQIAKAFIELMFADDSLQLYRVLLSQNEPNARLVTVFFETGPRRTLKEFESFLRLSVERGQIEVQDFQFAAECFFVLLKGVTHMRAIFAYGPKPDETERNRHAERVVALFLRMMHPAAGQRPLL